MFGHQLGSVPRSFNNAGKAEMAGAQSMGSWFSYLYHNNHCSSHNILARVFQNSITEAVWFFPPLLT